MLALSIFVFLIVAGLFGSIGYFCDWYSLPTRFTQSLAGGLSMLSILWGLAGGVYAIMWNHSYPPLKEQRIALVAQRTKALDEMNAHTHDSATYRHWNVVLQRTEIKLHDNNKKLGQLMGPGVERNW